MSNSTTQRLNFRVRPDTERRLRYAADASHQSLTDFVINAAEDRAEEVLALNSVVPADYFDLMLDALSEPARPIEAIQQLASAPRVSKRR